MAHTWRIRSDAMPETNSMMRRSIITTMVLVLATVLARPAGAAEPLRVCATVPELGSLVTVIGGAEITTTVFTKPTEDPHFTPARPSRVKEASLCELLVIVGLQLEMGWLPILLQGSRNIAIQRGGSGFLDASTTIVPIAVPQSMVDRSVGDIHAFGNPHYLVDPLNGLRVARLLRDRLSVLRPAARAQFGERLAAFERRTYTALVGGDLAAKYGSNTEKLARLHEQGRLVEFLRGQGELGRLGGWLGALQAHYGVRYVDDHRMWPYFARRFGLEYAGSLEPFNGVQPTTRHVQSTIEMMRATDVRLLLTAPYYDPRHARLVAEKTGAAVVRMANQAGAMPGTNDYLAMCDYNVRQVVQALAGTPGP